MSNLKLKSVADDIDSGWDSYGSEDCSDLGFISGHICLSDNDFAVGVILEALDDRAQTFHHLLIHKVGRKVVVFGNHRYRNCA